MIFSLHSEGQVRGYRVSCGILGLYLETIIV